MTQTLARIKQAGKNFEIMVDLDKALMFKKSGGSSIDFLEADTIFTDSKKGNVASTSDLKEAFGTENKEEVSERIVKNGEILLTQEHRDGEKDKKLKQVVDYFVINAIDPRTGNPFTPERIKSALSEAQVNIKNTPIDDQIKDIMAELSKIIPIKIEMKKIKVTIPAIYTGKAYGIVSKYKETEDWLPNGDLNITLNISGGSVMNFYDKLNSVTHGSALTEEIKEKTE